VCYDLPKIQGRVGVFGDVEPDSDGQLRRAVQRCIERWLEDYCHVDSSAASMLSQEDAISEQLREIGNKLARLDSEVATLMRLVIVRALCRAKHTLLKGGVG
jgi:phage-related tail protein